MLSRLSSLARSGVVALAALSSLATAAPAAPLGPSIMPAVADGGADKPILIEMGEGRDHGPGYGIWPRRGGGNWNGGGRNWNGGRHWDGGGNWDNGRSYRHYRGGYRRHNRGWDGGSGFVLGLGLGVPLGYYGGSYDNYDDGYYDVPVYRPRVIQRRVYRSGGGAHVEWCYNRYRSYRARDNSFQPYNGPRQRCYSPYS
jgi:hypothetical protein